MESTTTKTFIKDGDIAWEPVTEGMRRKIMAYDKSLMMVRVEFETGGIGTVHQHPHVQITHVEKGTFEVEIGGEKKYWKPVMLFTFRRMFCTARFVCKAAC